MLSLTQPGAPPLSGFTKTAILLELALAVGAIGGGVALVAFAVGGALIAWMAVEIAIVGYASRPPLQAIHLGLGVVIALVGVAWCLQQPGRRATARAILRRR